MPEQNLAAHYESDYDESADEDFNPDAPSSPLSLASRSPSPVPWSAPGLPDSGDEAIVARTSKKRKRGSSKKNQGRKEGKDARGSGGAQEDGAAEDGPFEVTTRSQRRAGRVKAAAGKDARRELAKSDVDVDAIFARMMNGGTPPQAVQVETGAEEVPSHTLHGSSRAGDAPQLSVQPSNASPEARQSIPSPSAPPTTAPPTASAEPRTVTISQTYTFAGETQTTTKVVPIDSEEAKLYLSQRPTDASSASSGPPSKAPAHGARQPAAHTKPLRRPTKRKNAFGEDVGPAAAPSKPLTSSSTTNASNAVRVGAASAQAKGTKLNTVQKSKLDWAQHVDKQGHAEELDKASKAKEGYLGRMDFLGRTGGA